MRRKGSIELISWLAGIASFFLALLAFAIDFTPSRSKEKMDKTDTSQVSIHQGQNNEGNQFGVINGSVIINNKGEDKNEKRKDINAVINDNQIGYDINHLDSEIGAPFKKKLWHKAI